MTEESENIVETFFKTFSGKDSCEKDVEDFGKRVSSYIEGQKWVTRPLVLSPLVCSRYGWKCINSNLLQCVTCTAKMYTPEPKIEIYDAYNSCIEKLLKNLKDSHKTHCPWPLAPSPESFVKLVPMPKEESLKLFMQRLKPSLEFSPVLPCIKECIPSQLGLDEQHVLSLCKLAEIPSEEAQEFGASIISLAATGWTLKSEGRNETKKFITCENCQRSIWCGSFNLLHTPNKEGIDGEITKESSMLQNGKRHSITLDESPASRNKRLKKEDFDPLEEHRPWCLWIANDKNKDIFQSKGDDENLEKSIESSCTPGWKIFMKSLLRNVCEPQNIDSENNPSKEQIRSVRNLLETWTDPME